MDTARIVQEIDAEIVRLTSARKILTGSNSSPHAKQRATTARDKSATRTKPVNRLSPAGRKRLSELMKKRWAERKKRATSKAK